MIGTLKHSWSTYVSGNPALPWVVLFLFVSLYVTQRGGTNPMARFAALRAVTEAGTLNIDNYKEWTVDWALSPNGHYYSNKAPGSLFLALPVFALTDVRARIVDAPYRDAQGRLPRPGYLAHLAVVLTVQLVPFAALMLMVTWALARRGVPTAGLHFFALAAMFGNTAALYMNSFFGHGLSAWLFLATLFFWLERRWVLTSLCLSWCVLNDYGALFLLPAFVLGTLYRDRDLRWVKPVLLGSLPALVLWCWYHTITFGSPLAIASVYANQVEIYHVPERHNLWGTFTFLPYAEFVRKLLFGPERGLLFTQPWVLVLLPCLVFFRSERALAGAAIVGGGGFLGLLWMNGGFGGWHSGWALGPRYLSLSLPALALLAALLWARLPMPARAALWTGLAVSLIFRWVVLPFSVVVPVEPLWPMHWDLLRHATSPQPYVRLAVAALAAAVAALWAARSDAAARRRVLVAKPYYGYQL